ncbi:MAG: hypothetical protein K8W52_44680 [Deltaproteobacteria bacterium]|nr:hypothetical protein [Deltaproteobacteria bacterium]
MLDLGAGTPRTAAASDPDSDEPAARPTAQRTFLIGGLAITAVALIVIIVVAIRAGSGGANAVAASTGQAATNAAPPAPRPAAEPLPPPKPDLPAWVRLRVQRVQIAPSDVAWDGPTPDTSLRSKCDGLASLAALHPTTRPLGLVCTFINRPQRQADPADPDLQVLLEVPGVRYASYVAFDTRSHAFDYSFIVPARAVPADGLLLTVVDADTDSPRGREIGSVRLAKDELAEAVSRGTLLPLHPDGLNLLEVEVSAYDGSYTHQELSLATSAGGAYVRGIEVNAGDVVRIEASGSWRIGTWHNDVIGPAGFPNGALHGSNLAPFPDVAHGAAVALVGANGATTNLHVDGCAKMVSPFSGLVWVGVNDREFGDNRGQVDFAIKKRGANAAQWADPGTLMSCD